MKKTCYKFQNNTRHSLERDCLKSEFALLKIVKNNSFGQVKLGLATNFEIVQDTCPSEID